MTCKVTDSQFAAFLDNRSLELVEHVGTCRTCQQRLEDSVPMTSGVVEGTMRAVQVDWMGKELGKLVFDLGARYVSAFGTYLGRAS